MSQQRCGRPVLQEGVQGGGGRRGAAEDGDAASVRVGAELHHWCRKAAEELPGCKVDL